MPSSPRPANVELDEDALAPLVVVDDALRPGKEAFPTPPETPPPVFGTPGSFPLEASRWMAVMASPISGGLLTPGSLRACDGGDKDE